MPDKQLFISKRLLRFPFLQARAGARNDENHSTSLLRGVPMAIGTTKRSLMLLLFFLAILSGCRDPKQEEKPVINNGKIRQQFIKANQQVVQKESDEMDYYQKSHQLSFVKTNAGIRYDVYKASAKGDSIKDGDMVTMNFTVSLLDGTECYSSRTAGPKEFMVGQDDLESGIHKGIQYVKNGDKVLFLIPSHLAHGLLGDYKKIPPQSPILYEVEVLSVKKHS